MFMKNAIERRTVAIDGLRKFCSELDKVEWSIMIYSVEGRIIQRVNSKTTIGMVYTRLAEILFNGSSDRLRLFSVTGPMVRANDTDSIESVCTRYGTHFQCMAVL